jgi:protein-disulfide isomerase
MKSRRESVVFIAILAVFLFVGGAIGNYLRSPDQKKGDPNDVTGYVKRNVLLGSPHLERGAQNPRFILVEFADFQCQSCGKAEPMVRELIQKRKDTRLVYRHYPIPAQHANAEIAARAAEIANLQGKGWEMHDALFDRQADWANEENVQRALTSVAKSIGLDSAKFSSELAGSAKGPAALRVEHDQQIAFDCSVERTPSFFLITPTKIWAGVGPVALERLVGNPRYWE